VSIYCSWRAAMTPCATLLANGATGICIFAIDLERLIELIPDPGIRRCRLTGVVNAYSVAVRNGLTNLDVFGYHTSGPRGFPKEYLIPCGVPKGEVVGCIPGLGAPQNIAVHLGELQVPMALVAQAGGANGNMIRTWVKSQDEIVGYVFFFGLV
jgi:hypothetical protein